MINSVEAGIVGSIIIIIVSAAHEWRYRKMLKLYKPWIEGLIVKNELLIGQCDEVNRLRMNHAAALEKCVESLGEERNQWADQQVQADYILEVTNEKLKKAERDCAGFENTLAAVAVRDSHYPALQAQNASMNAVVTGMKERMATTPLEPFGKFTGKFDKIEDLILFLLFVNRPENQTASGPSSRKTTAKKKTTR